MKYPQNVMREFRNFVMKPARWVVRNRRSTSSIQSLPTAGELRRAGPTAGGLQ